MIDLHLHLLPGIDDGPPDMDAAVRLAGALVSDGVEEVAVSPHVSDRYPNSPAAIAEGVAALGERLASEGLVLPVHTGAEIAIDRVNSLSDDELVALSVAGRGRHLLIEVPYAAWPFDIEVHVSRVESLGMTVVLAHPERCAAVQADAAPLRRLVDRGVLAQATAGSVTGRSGRAAERAARELIGDGTIQLLGSDAHGVEARPPRMTEAVTALADAALAEWLTTAVPAAVLAGEAPPPRPQSGARRRRRIFGRRR